jgi:hypothetical protein
MIQPEFRTAAIAFDGCCRVGKGEQLRELHSYFTSRGVPAMVLKGDGTRLGCGEAWHDLGSRYWTHTHDYHAGIHTPYEEWDRAAYDLARENIAWLNALKRIAFISRSRFAAAIYDRSIISRATLALQREMSEPGERLSPEQMWPSHLQTEERISYYDTTPDILFNLSAPQEELHKRIQPSDYDRAFRVRAIDIYYDCFMRAKNALPKGTTTTIIELDGLMPVKELAAIVIEHLEEMYSEVLQLRDVMPMHTEYTENS